MKISIVTICLNEAKKIEKTIRSVISQDYAGIEYIIIDGGSTDGTLDIIQNYEGKIDVVISESDKGIFDAQNKGIKKATGGYILILNAGDYLYRNDSISKIAGKIDGEDILYSDVIFEMPGKFIYRKHSQKKITALNMFVETIPHPATFYKSDVFKKAGYYDLEYLLSADYDFILKCIFKYNFKYKYIRFPLSVFNLEGISSDNNNKKLFFDEREKIQRKYFPSGKLFFLKLFSPIIIFFRKKIYYLYFYLRSKFDNNFLSTD